MAAEGLDTIMKQLVVKGQNAATTVVTQDVAP